MKLAEACRCACATGPCLILSLSFVGRFVCVCVCVYVCGFFLFMFVLDPISARSLSFFLSFSPRFVQVWCQFPIVSFFFVLSSLPPSLREPSWCSAVLLLVYITLGRWGGEIGADVGKIGNQDCRNGSF
jgi:hypothetical protein